MKWVAALWKWLAAAAPPAGRLVLTLLAVGWAFVWYAPAWLAGHALANLRRGWSDGSNRGD